MPMRHRPWKASTSLFTLERPGQVHLAVYDVLGREVAVLVDGRRPAGAQQATFEAAGLPSGLYLYRLEAGGRVEAQRMTLLK